MATLYIATPDPSRTPWPEDGITAQVGNTPLLNLSQIARLHNIALGVELHAKAEWFNPSGSVKDRAALYMVRDGEERGLLVPGKTILDASSGNTGIGLAMIGAARGYRVEICLPAGASHERKRLLKLYGASIIETPASLGTDGAIAEARRLYALDQQHYFYPDQYNNPANWQAHYFGTGPEIWRQTRGRVTHFVAVVGTSGTLVGAARSLKQYNPAIHVTEVQPDSAFHGLEGMKHMPSALVPGIYDPDLADVLVRVGTEEAQATTREMARRSGILTGPSSGAAVRAALNLALTLTKGVVVTLLPDGGSRYLEDSFWDEEGSR